jgi:Fe-S-cluster containining protein
LNKELRKDIDRVLSRKKEIKALFKRLASASSKSLNKLFHPLHNEVFSKVNCLDCAHCCTHTGPLFTQSDVSRIAPKLGLTALEFRSTYLRIDEDGDSVLQDLPCTFLDVNTRECKIYEYRPKACREYPHTNHEEMRSILGITEKNTFICPATARMVLKILRDKNI